MIKQFFYQPKNSVEGNYNSRGRWMVQFNCNTTNYKKSTAYKWLVENCKGDWEIDTFMCSTNNGEHLYVMMYDQADALSLSLHYNVTMPAAYELDVAA